MFESEFWFTEYNEVDFAKRTSSMGFKVRKHLVHDRSDFQVIDIIDTYEYGKMLILDGMVMITEKDEFIYHDMITHVPANLLKYHGKDVKKALVIGGGDGGTVRELRRNDSIDEVVLCEIDGKVVEYSKKHFPQTAGELDNPKVKVIIGDGIEFMKGKTDEYDIICIDSTDPIGPAVGLFNKDFYQNVFKALKDDGIVTAQQESYIRHPEFLEVMNKMLKEVFPYVNFYRADISTYPSGTWCFMISSKKFDPISCKNNDFIEKISFESKYYNSYIHQAAFSLPTYIRDIL